MVSEKAQKPAKVEPVPEKDAKAPEDPAAAAGSTKNGELRFQTPKNNSPDGVGSPRTIY